MDYAGDMFNLKGYFKAIFFLDNNFVQYNSDLILPTSIYLVFFFFVTSINFFSFLRIY